MNLEKKYISKLKEENTLVDIYTDNYDESDFGYIIDFNNDFLVLEKFDEDSNPDGISILLRRNITRIRWGGNEITSTSKLIDNSIKAIKTNAIDLNSIKTILKTVISIYGYITVHIQDVDANVCFIGQIHEMDDASIVIHEYGTKSSLDRKFILISLENITRIDAGGIYETKLVKLYN